MFTNAKNVRLASFLALTCSLRLSLALSGAFWISPCLSLALYGSLWLPLWLSLALIATLWHTLALSGSLLLSNFAYTALDRLTGPLLGSHRRCHDDALYPSLPNATPTLTSANISKTSDLGSPTGSLLTIRFYDADKANIFRQMVRSPSYFERWIYFVGGRVPTLYSQRHKTRLYPESRSQHPKNFQVKWAEPLHTSKALELFGYFIWQFRIKLAF